MLNSLTKEKKPGCTRQPSTLRPPSGLGRQLRPAEVRKVIHDGVAVQFRRLRHLADVDDKWGPGAHDRKQAAEFPHVCDIDATQLRQFDFQNQVHHFLYLRQVVDVLFQEKGVVAFFLLF